MSTLRFVLAVLSFAALGAAVHAEEVADRP